MVMIQKTRDQGIQGLVNTEAKATAGQHQSIGKGIVSLLQIMSYFSHCFKKWRNFTFARVKNSFRMQMESNFSTPAGLSVKSDAWCITWKR